MGKYEEFILSLTNKARQQKLDEVEAGILCSNGKVAGLEAENSSLKKTLDYDDHTMMIVSKKDYEQLQTEIVELKESLEDMCYQFAGWSNGGYSTNGLSALEQAFGVLGWSDPQVCKEVQCDEPGCTKQRTCGFPTDKGYRNTCSEHWKQNDPH